MVKTNQDRCECHFSGKVVTFPQRDRAETGDSGGRWTPRKLVDAQLLLRPGWPYVSIPFIAPRPNNLEDPEEAVAGTTL